MTAARRQSSRSAPSEELLSNLQMRVSASLPGHELVAAGIRDLAAGRESEASLLVAMAAPRLRAVGFEIPDGGGKHPSHRLYELLSEHDAGDAHSRYNALVRRIASFSRAAEHAPTS